MGMSWPTSGKGAARPVNNSKFFWFESTRPGHLKSSSSDQLWHSCHDKGHWKTECPVLRSKGGHLSAKKVKPAVFTALAGGKGSFVSERLKTTVALKPLLQRVLCPLVLMTVKCQ